VNTTDQVEKIPIAGTRKGIIENRDYTGILTLGPWQAELMP
jgi:hypothetical protein